MSTATENVRLLMAEKHICDRGCVCPKCGNESFYWRDGEEHICHWPKCGWREALDWVLPKTENTIRLRYTTKE